MNNFDKFMIGLEKLTKETGIAIDGCGCCGSPVLKQITVRNSKKWKEQAGYSGYKDETGDNSYTDIDWVDSTEVSDDIIIYNKHTLL